MKKLFTPFALLASAILGAQPLPYTLSTWNEPYTELEAPVMLTGDEVWDDPQLFIPIGFAFEMMGETFEDLLLLEPGAQVLPSLSEDSLNVFGPYYADLIDAGYAQDTSLSSISYELTGTTGSRILKIQFKNVAFYGEYAELGTSNNRTNFQLWLYEGTFDFEYRYGENSIKDGTFVHALGAPLVFVAKNASLAGDGGFETLWLFGGDPANPETNTWENVDTPPGPELLLNGEPAPGTVYHFDTGIVSVNETVTRQSLRVFPSLTAGELFVSISTGQSETVMIHDARGAAVRQLLLTNGIHTIDVSELPAGTYVMRSMSGQHEAVRFIKQ
jgi:hypothetical protein